MPRPFRPASRCVRAAALAAGAVIACAPTLRAQARPDSAWEVVARRDVMIPARDGIRLATDVYLPGRNGIVTGRFPAIVERTPYNKASGAESQVQYFVSRG